MSDHHAVEGSPPSAVRIVRHSVVVLAVSLLLLGLVVYLLTLLPWFKPHPILTILFQATGQLLIGVGVGNVIVAVYSRMALQTEFTRAMTTVVSSEGAALRDDVKNQIRWLWERLDEFRHFDQYGLRAIRSQPDISNLLKSLRKDDTLWLLDTYAKSYEDWRGDLKLALERGAKANLLVLHPHSSIAQMRALEIAQETSFIQDFVHNVEAFKNKLDRLSATLDAEHRKNLSIRFYDSLPCAPMYIVERGERCERAFTSYFLLKPTDYNFPHFEWVDAHEGTGGLADSFGMQLLAYVKNKWEFSERGTRFQRQSASRPPGYIDPALGYWIYTLDFCTADHPRKQIQRVYGFFFVYFDGIMTRAEGEAFYFGKPPNRTQRRGLWRSRTVEVLAGMTGININYDMLIQNGGPVGDTGVQYIGELKFSTDDSDPPFEKPLTGEFFSMAIGFVGTARAFRLSTPPAPARLGKKRTFPEQVAELFKTHLGETIFDPTVLGDVIPTQADSGNGDSPRAVGDRSSAT
jgi:hypothetical protein